MNILFAASEAAPFAKTGGLADVAGSLPPALAALGHKTALVMPRYREVDVRGLKLKRVASLTVPIGAWQERCDVLLGTTPAGVPVYFIDKDAYFDRPELYGTARSDYPDNDERFIFFSRALLEMCKVLELRFDVIHCNDWQTGIVPLLLERFYRSSPALNKTRTVFTIHNLGYQGHFPKEALALTGLGWDVYTPEGIEYWDGINLMKAGLVSADAITTVSKTYSREMQTPEYGRGLDGVLRNRAADVYGILNGIDADAWDPWRDRTLKQRFSAARPEGKTACRSALLSRLRLEDSDAPIIGMVTRLADQKGLDILLPALPAILATGARLVVLGSGDELYHRALSAAELAHPDRMRVLLQYDESIARAIYAGCDLFLMPSHYEPCGLGQMIAFRYGTVPVVRKTGGLADTVSDYHEKGSAGDGFVFSEYSSAALAACVRRALSVYENAAVWTQLMQTGMRKDFSWKQSAREYEKIYKSLIRTSRNRT
jgi:starch synthase